MDIHGDEFKELVLRAIRKVLEEEKQVKTQARRRVYVILSDSFQDPCESFLHSLSGKDDVYVVVPDEWTQGTRTKITGLCPCCQIINRTKSVNLPLQDSLTVYPVVSRSFAAKAALCISDTFETLWLERCLSEGAAVHFMLSGLQKFSGREPQAYVQKVLSYYSTLLQYGISIGAFPEEPMHPAESCAETPAAPVPASKTVRINSRVITTADIYPYGPGTVISLCPGTIITSCAREGARQKQIRFIES